MTEIEPEIETLRVTVEELIANREHYWIVKETKRLEILHEGERVATMGPWLPAEERYLTPKFFWFLDQLEPPGPVDHEGRTTQLLIDEREEHRSF